MPVFLLYTGPTHNTQLLFKPLTRLELVLCLRKFASTPLKASQRCLPLTPLAPHLPPKRFVCAGCRHPLPRPMVLFKATKLYMGPLTLGMVWNPVACILSSNLIWKQLKCFQ